jgi:hypothetical protein
MGRYGLFYSIYSCLVGGAADPWFFSDNDGRYISTQEHFWAYFCVVFRAIQLLFYLSASKEKGVLAGAKKYLDNKASDPLIRMHAILSTSTPCD